MNLTKNFSCKNFNCLGKNNQVDAFLPQIYIGDPHVDFITDLKAAMASLANEPVFGFYE